MYLLDTDTANLALRGNPHVLRRVVSMPSPLVWLSSIAAEELVQGSIGRINWDRSRPDYDVTTSSRFFVKLLRDLCDFQLLPYTDEANRLFRSWPNAVRRVGSNDCRIAASAIVHGYTVVTCNGKDFSRIPGIAFEDWSL